MLKFSMVKVHLVVVATLTKLSNTETVGASLSKPFVVVTAETIKVSDVKVYEDLLVFSCTLASEEFAHIAKADIDYEEFPTPAEKSCEAKVDITGPNTYDDYNLKSCLVEKPALP